MDGAASDGFVQLSAGYETTCVNRNGDVWCWGENDDGFVGVADAGVRDGDAGPFVNIPVRVPLPKKIDEIAAGTTTVVRAGGAVLSWAGGWQGDGAWVGNGLQGPSPPVALQLDGVAGLPRHAVSAADVCSGSGGHFVCWGGNAFGQLTFPESPPFPQPTKIAALAGADEVTLGNRLTCARWGPDLVKCAGNNDRGQLGAGTVATSRHTLEPVLGLRDVVQLTAGADHACARSGDGTIRCWGDNERGAIGDGTTAAAPPFARATPSQVSGVRGARLVVAGGSHTCAIAGDHRVLCWGFNQFGQLGDGTRTDRASPVYVSNLTDVEQLDVGIAHSCAVARSGALFCWGYNAKGAVGDGTFEDRLVPTPVKLPP